MKKEEVQKIVEDTIVTKMGIEREDISLDSKFNDDYGLDSLDMIELLMELEKELGIYINDDQWEEVRTVEDVVNLAYSIIP
jgi:acyl carrier protein